MNGTATSLLGLALLVLAELFAISGETTRADDRARPLDTTIRPEVGNTAGPIPVPTGTAGSGSVPTGTIPSMDRRAAPIEGPLETSFLPAAPAPSGAEPSTDSGRQLTTMAAGDRKSLIEKALQLSGAPVTEENVSAVNLIVQKESSWDPRAKNDGDRNAKQGNPSEGLMQTTQTTFKENALPGYESITDPLSNLIAGIRYSVKRYGSLSEVPGVASIAKGGAYKPY